MTHMKSNFEGCANARIKHRVPDCLIIKKAEGLSASDFTVYDLIAHFAGLNYVADDVYVDRDGEQYVRTKFGLEPAERYNANLRLQELERVNSDLRHRRKEAQTQAELYRDKIKSMEESNRQRHAMVRPCQEENESLKREIRLLKRQLAEFKNASSNVAERLKQLINETNEEELTAKFIYSELDWSTYKEGIAGNEE